jgi:hypothetical protein
VPTTYAGAEWTPYFGIRDEAARVKSGGSGANTVGILYEPALTLGLSRRQSGGTAMNALAHCVEARYVSDSTDGNDGAALIDEWLPHVLENGQDAEARRRLLEGAMHAGIALRDHGLYLGHAMAQALGGRYGLPHGALNAICLPAAMRFNGATEPIGVERVEELARLCGFTRLRDLEVPEPICARSPRRPRSVAGRRRTRVRQASTRSRSSSFRSGSGSAAARLEEPRRGGPDPEDRGGGDDPEPDPPPESVARTHRPHVEDNGGGREREQEQGRQVERGRALR